LEGWKRKRDLEIIQSNNNFQIITYKKGKEKPSRCPVISKEDVNKVICIINELDNGWKIPTREIAELMYNKTWGEVYADRKSHTQLNSILRILDYYGKISYIKGFTKVLKKIETSKELENKKMEEDFKNKFKKTIIKECDKNGVSG
jgi:hypothetical protein